MLKDALRAAKGSGIPEDKVFIIDIPGFENPRGFRTVDDLIELGRGSPELEPLRWSKGQGARQVAFLCYSSGTSGLPVRPAPTACYYSTESADMAHRKPS